MIVIFYQHWSYIVYPRSQIDHWSLSSAKGLPSTAHGPSSKVAKRRWEEPRPSWDDQPERPALWGDKTFANDIYSLHAKLRGKYKRMRFFFVYDSVILGWRILFIICLLLNWNQRTMITPPLPGRLLFQCPIVQKFTLAWLSPLVFVPALDSFYFIVIDDRSPVTVASPWTFLFTFILSLSVAKTSRSLSPVTLLPPLKLSRDPQSVERNSSSDYDYDDSESFNFPSTVAWSFSRTRENSAHAFYL